MPLAQDIDHEMTRTEAGLWKAAVETRGLVRASVATGALIASANVAVIGLAVNEDGVSVIDQDFDITQPEAHELAAAAEDHIRGLAQKEQRDRRLRVVQEQASSLFEGLFFDLRLVSGEAMTIQYQFDYHMNSRFRGRKLVQGWMDHLDLANNQATIQLNRTFRDNYTTVPILTDEDELAIRINTRTR